jgi:hypothetical protein
MNSFILVNIGVQVLVMAVAWWVSGYDTRLTNENAREDFLRRGFRCLLTFLLIELMFWAAWHSTVTKDRFSGFVYIALSIPLALYWSGCISNLLAHLFHALIDSNDKRPFDPKQEVRILDSIGQLVRSGRKEEAIRMCELLKTTGEVSEAALALTLEHLGVAQNTGRVKPIAEADRLRSAGKFNEAESMLKALLLENPKNLEAVMMLVRLYLNNLNQPDKAADVLAELEKQPHVPPAFLEIARRTITDHGSPLPPAVENVAHPESVEQMLAQGYFGTAAETIEAKIKEKPEDFDLRLKLLEIQAVHCKNPAQAQKILRDLQADPMFTRAQIESARVKVEAWTKQA